MSFQWVVRILFLSLAIQFSHQQTTTDCSFSANCDTTENDAHIICSAYGTPECECQDDLPGNTCGDVDVSTVAAADMDATKCAELCGLSSATCMFWKYKSFGSGVTESNQCFLMNKDQCQASEDNECEALNCAGGDLGDSGTSPAECKVSSCPGPITEGQEDGDNFVQKWECYISTGNTRDVTTVDMYAPDASMPVGGFCKLNMDDGGSCKPPSPEFRFDCERDPLDSSVKWMPSGGIDDTDILGGDGELQDIDCSAANLEFTNPDLVSQSGRDLHCRYGGVTVADDGAGGVTTFIPAENDCLMTCDDYSVLLFYTDYDKASVDGGRAWFFEVFGVTMEPVKMDNADVLNCWG